MDFIDTFFNWPVIVRTWPLLMAGVGNTLLLSLTTIIGGGIGGVAVCLMRLYAPRPMNWLAIAFIDLFRAIPILVLLILVYYALPFMGIRLDSFSSAALALGLVFSAFTAEVVRAGILAIPAGQLEAAKSIGLPFWVTMQRVVLPQALRVALPPHTSNCVAIAKDTSLASVVAMPDLLKQATDAQALVANPSPLIAAALLYLCFLLPAVRLVALLEEKFKQERR